MARTNCFLAVLAVAIIGLPAAGGPCDVTPSPAWENSIVFPNDPFRANGSAEEDPGWVKFTILTCDPATVYFQDSNLYPFHYEFAVEFFDAFAGMSVEEFGAVTLFNEGRLGVLGAVVLPPQPFGSPQIQEYGIQLIGEDPFDPHDVVDYFNTARAAVSAAPEVKAFYFPTFEQRASAEENSAFLEANGIIISSPARWASGNSCYSKGWALGRLNFVTATEIDAAFLAGDLQPGDILLTDGVPASVPLVAGILTTAPATPNSHVAILASTFQIPFAFLGLQADADLALSLDGRRIVLRAYDELVGLTGVCELRLIDVEDELTQQQIDEILALKDPPPLNIQPIAPLGALARSTDNLTPSHIQYFGGKAANFGFLRRSIPENSPVSLGLSFDLWTGFLDQTLTGGSTLRAHVDSILAGHSFPPIDMQALSSDLQGIRDLIEDTDLTAFTAAQRIAVLDALQNPQYAFDPLQKLRFRSSTNVEDSEQFTGAGLYDSKSGCLADELDGDDSGPGLCDPSEDNEKGVFRAIRKVFASFYNDNAVLERLRYGVDEADVGMALLVHHSFPDPIELANGVATLRREPGMNDTIDLVTQLGAESVTNPSPGSIPEEVEVTVFPPSVIVPTLVVSSNLVILGDTVMEWTADYVELSQLLLAATDQFQSETGKNDFLLDFEYKKMAPGGGALPAGGLVVKQIRQIPLPDTTPSITPFLVNEPLGLVPWGSPPGRVKARWNLSTRNMWLDPAELAAQSIYTDVTMEFTDECRILDLDGTVPTLPGAAHTYDAVAALSLDSWVLSDLPNPRTYTLRTEPLGELVSPAESPILTLGDLARFGLAVTIQHQDPVPQIPGSASMITSEVVTMIEALDENEDIPICRTLDAGGGVTADTCYFIHPPPDACGGCAPILSRFGTTVVQGVTTAPIILDDFFSQTYRASPHAFFETFDFEPRLERGISLETLQELDALGARVIRFDVGNVGDPFVYASYFGDLEVGEVCDPPTGAGSLVAAAPPLTLDKAAGGDVTLAWGASCLTTDDDFEIYEGVLGDFTSHLPRTCSTAGALGETLPPSPADSYYLVVPRNANFEGSYGLDGAGFERPTAAAACTGQELASCP